MAQNSCNKEAILEFDDFWLGTHCFVAQNHFWRRHCKMVVELFVVQIRQSNQKHPFLWLQTIEIGNEFAVTTLRNMVLSPGYLH